MIQKYVFGTPFETDAVITPIPAAQGRPPQEKEALSAGEEA